MGTKPAAQYLGHSFQKDKHLNAEQQPDPLFAAGDDVTIIKTGRQGKVVHNIYRDGRLLYLVDQPHGGGILRQYYTEEEISAS